MIELIYYKANFMHNFDNILKKAVIRAKHTTKRDGGYSKAADEAIFFWVVF